MVYNFFGSPYMLEIHNELFKGEMLCCVGFTSKHSSQSKLEKQVRTGNSYLISTFMYVENLP